MRFSKEMEQALRSLGWLQRRGVLISAREISDQQDIPFEKLSKILQKLAAGQVVEAYRGRQGGYILKMPLEELSLMDLHLILNESVKVVPCFIGKSCQIQKDCSIQPGMARFQNELDRLLVRYTVADFVGSLPAVSLEKEEVYG